MTHVTASRENQTSQAEIAKTILSQCGVEQLSCLVAVGARDYVALDANKNRKGGVMFRVTISPGRCHKIIVELTHHDEYNVILWGGKRSALNGERLESRLAWCETLGDTVYDASLANKLQNLANSIR